MNRTEGQEPSARLPKKHRDAWLVRLPAHLVMLGMVFLAAYVGGSMYWLVKKDNEVEKFRRLEIELQNQIKERDLQIQQSKQKIEQLGRRVEILDAIQELSSADITPSDQRKIASMVYEQSEKYGHDPFLLLAIMSAESSLKPGAQSEAGAHGLMQLMPSTGRSLAKMVKADPKLIGAEDHDEITSLNMRDIEGNIQLGTLYFTQLMVRYKSLEEAIYAYNLGPNLYDKRKKEGGPLPRQYYRKIVRTFNRLQQLRDDKSNAPIPIVFAQTGDGPMLAQAE